MKTETRLNFLDELEAEAIFVLRETAAQFKTPALLFSGGKDSVCMTRLAEKAFRPGKIPYIFLHIDTGHNFPETLDFRDKFLNQLLIYPDEVAVIRTVEDSIKNGRVNDVPKNSSRNALQSVTLLDAIAEFHFDAVIGGARRDEEKARAKERIFSVRDFEGRWDPHAQRPEPWRLFNPHLKTGGHFRIFPLSHWTELDVWNYIHQEQLSLPSIYFSHQRKCVRRGQSLVQPLPTETPSEPLEELWVRCRTVGDMTCTGLIPSRASTVNEVIAELKTLRISERGGRLDDQTSDTAMEDRKRQGYF